MEETEEIERWASECAQGRKEAEALIERMVAEANPLLMRKKLATLGDFNTDGVANGFVQEVAERLILGALHARALRGR